MHVATLCIYVDTVLAIEMDMPFVCTLVCHEGVEIISILARYK